jgi:hypothetical protein
VYFEGFTPTKESDYALYKEVETVSGWHSNSEYGGFGKGDVEGQHRCRNGIVSPHKSVSDILELVNLSHILKQDFAHQFYYPGMLPW